MVHGPKCIGLNLRAFGCDGSCDGLSVHVVRFNPHFVVPFKTVFAFAVGLSVFGFAFGLTVFAFALGFPAFAFALGFGTAFSFGTVSALERSSASERSSPSASLPAAG